MRRAAVLPFAVGATALVIGFATLFALIKWRTPPAKASPTDKEKPMQVRARCRTAEGRAGDNYRLGTGEGIECRKDWP